MINKLLIIINKLFYIDLSRISKTEKAIFITLLFLSLFSFLISMGDVIKYGGVDLRNKVVGAREFWIGIDPYKSQSKPPTNDWLLDPARRYPGPSNATVTPPVLMFYGVIAWLPYSIQRWIWAILEWFAMLASILLLARTIGSHKIRYVFLTSSMLFFLSGYFWRLHVERGQYYIFLTFLLSLAIYLELHLNRLKSSALVFGLLAAMRPTFFLAIPLFLIFKKYKKSYFMLATFIICIGVTILICGIKPWVSYFKNVEKKEAVIIDHNFQDRYYGARHPVPDEAEGIKTTIAMPGHACNETFIGVCKDNPKFDKLISSFNLSIINKLMCLVTIIIGFVLAYLSSKNHYGNRFSLIFIITLIISIDYFVPERYPYVDVLFLPIWGLIVPVMFYHAVSVWFYITILLSFALNQGLWFFSGAAGVLARSLLFMGSVILLILCLIIRKTIYRNGVRASADKKMRIPFNQKI